MSVIFSRSCEYALQAVMYIAMQPKNQMVLLKEVAEKVNIPKHFLGKILQKLAKSGLLDSQKGPNGGFALYDSPNKINALMIVEAIDGLDLMNKCVAGFPECHREDPCPYHDEWAEIRAKIKEMLERETIEKLMEDAKAGKRVPFLKPGFALK
ncbi:MAG: Rrf2 family transcriptional regulator [Bacteroidetes bacterium]|nr:Rrf2 family transcriptional regulator [Bacteroidota bacterium]